MVVDTLLRAVRARARAWQVVLLCLPALWGGDPPEELDNATHAGCKGDLDRGERRILRRLPERRRALIRFC